MFSRLGILLTGSMVCLLFGVSASSAQSISEQPMNGLLNSSVATQAGIYFNSVLSEADKNFIVATFSNLTDKVTSCRANPLTQFISITYNKKLMEKDILEVLQMNGYDAYLRKGEHLKVVLTVNGEAKEELVK